MYDISNLNEARNLLAKDRLNADDTRQLLLFLVESSADTQNKFRVLGTILKPLIESLLPLFESFKYVAIPDIELRGRLEDAVRSLRDAAEALQGDALIH